MLVGVGIVVIRAKHPNTFHELTILFFLSTLHLCTHTLSILHLAKTKMSLSQLKINPSKGTSVRTSVASRVQQQEQQQQQQEQKQVCSLAMVIRQYLQRTQLFRNQNRPSLLNNNSNQERDNKRSRTQTTMATNSCQDREPLFIPIPITALAHGLDADSKGSLVTYKLLCNLIYGEALKSSSSLLTKITTGTISVLKKDGNGLWRHETGQWHDQFKQSNVIKQRDMIVKLARAVVAKTLYVSPRNHMVAKSSPTTSTTPVSGFLREVVIQKLKVELYTFLQQNMKNNQLYINASAAVKIGAITFIAKGFVNRTSIDDAQHVLNY